ncbi:hypothetical protein [Streptomyces sp. NPDC048521]|uniref:allene oxide cyclase barrel-like domain-containing protein n=1 Tax=Streptomyces sp. NPDC048521 TaxID=3365566 RepID=UPI0037180CF7
MPTTSRIKKVRFLTAAVGTAAVIASTLAIGPASAIVSDHGARPGAHSRTEIIHLVAKQTQAADLDLGKKGLSLGDERIVAEDLYRDGKKVGDHSVVCTYTHLNPEELQCLGTYSLPEGLLTGQAILHLPAPSSVDLAITGGTGVYDTARGYITTVPAGVSERQLTVHLNR